MGHSRPNFTVHRSWVQLEVGCLVRGAVFVYYPPLGQAHQAEWSAMWGRGITVRRAHLFMAAARFTPSVA